MLIPSSTIHYLFLFFSDISTWIYSLFFFLYPNQIHIAEYISSLWQHLCLPLCLLLSPVTKNLYSDTHTLFCNLNRNWFPSTFDSSFFSLDWLTKRKILCSYSNPFGMPLSSLPTLVLISVILSFICLCYVWKYRRNK